MMVAAADIVDAFADADADAEILETVTDIRVTETVVEETGKFPSALAALDEADHDSSHPVINSLCTRGMSQEERAMY